MGLRFGVVGYRAPTFLAYATKIALTFPSTYGKLIYTVHCNNSRSILTPFVHNYYYCDNAGQSLSFWPICSF